MAQNIRKNGFRVPREALKRKPKPPFLCIVTTESDGKSIVELFWLGKDVENKPDMRIAERQALAYAEKRRADGYKVTVSSRSEGPPIPAKPRRSPRGKGYFDRMSRQQFKDYLP